MNLKLLAFFRNYTQIGKSPTKITEVELNKGKWDNNSNLERDWDGLVNVLSLAGKNKEVKT